MNGDFWKQAILTGGIAALTAFGGLQVGLAESKAKQAALEKRVDQFQSSMEYRLIRLEDRISALYEVIVSERNPRTKTR